MTHKSLSPVDYAFLLLSFRMRSKDEMRQRLIKKGYTEDEVNGVIDKLEGLNYLNDREFAQTWVKSRIVSKPLGRSLMYRELKRKGIAVDIIEDVLNESLKGYDEYEVAKELALKRLGKIKVRDSKMWQRLSGYLARRGFSYEVNKKVLKEILDGDEDNNE